MPSDERERELRLLFSSLTTRGEVAAMLGVSDDKLRHLLYRIPERKRYHKFQIQKKSGGLREITAPIPELMEVQRRLNELLGAIYQPRLSTHGFAKGRSIVTNAEAHLRSRYVFNLDLAEFFPSINFGRVMGMFQKKPFSCQRNVAIILAQICCTEKKLPQGAPTSPLVSNIICSRMDVALQRFARKHACVYIIQCGIEPRHRLEPDFRELRIGEQVIIRGFPKYAYGASDVAVVAQITGHRPHFGVTRYLVDKPIVVGNSGGPVLDMNGKVIGVAASGISDESEENPDQQFGIIPIQNLRKILINLAL